MCARVENRNTSTLTPCICGSILSFGMLFSFLLLIWPAIISYVCCSSCLTRQELMFQTLTLSCLATLATTS